MKVLASAPGRAGILGNPTDGYGGAVMSCSLAERASVTLAGSEVLRATVHLGSGRAASPSVLPPASSDTAGQRATDQRRLGERGAGEPGEHQRHPGQQRWDYRGDLERYSLRLDASERGA